MDRRYGTILVPHDVVRDITKVKKLYADLEFTPLSTLFRPEVLAIEVMGYSPKFKNVRTGQVPPNYRIKTIKKHHKFDRFTWEELVKFAIEGEY